MTNMEQLKILRQGVADWNKWRIENPDDRIDLSGAGFKEVNLSGANLNWANLNKAKFYKADLSGAYLHGAKLREADLTYADLSGANLNQANLNDADFRQAKLYGAKLNRANLSGANLSGTDLSWANLSQANLEGATLVDCNIYAISAWGLVLKNTTQRDLIITPPDQPAVTVDSIEVAQFIYLLLNNEKIRDVIDTVAKKAILILGRFTPERKIVLDALRTELRNRGYLPIVFDFDKPSTRDFTETVRILVGMSLFVIADISNPKSCPLELQATIPDYMVPFVPIIQEDEEPFSMFKDLHMQYKRWVLAPLKYDSVDGLIRVLDKAIINPALEVHNNLLAEKAAEMPQRHVKDYS